MNITEEERRNAFGIWLRTGRWPGVGKVIEVKFNHWHDSQNGRFTFAGSGDFYGDGGGGGGRPGGGFTGGGGGDFGGGGASGSWDAPVAKPKAPNGAQPQSDAIIVVGPKPSGEPETIVVVGPKLTKVVRNQI